ncbi:asparagine synthase-related protein [Streptomyces sp. NPDC002506]|uniref:asparagine synthase-related protein n=1 Tax=Streptomyces sp. NPDC002506 TaxID=3154536 RepID=UPI00331720FD
MPHPSGRPWILADLPHSRLTDIRSGADALVLIGPGPVEPDPLRTELGRCRDIAELDRVLARLPGVFHALATVGGTIRVQGTASGLRQIYRTRHGETLLVGDRAQTLAELVGAPVDEAALALRLLEPVPHPLGERTAWHGIAPTPPGSYLRIDGRQAVVVRRWWELPSPTRLAADGAGAVHEAMESSVRLHMTGRGMVSTELSGGLDSTTVGYLAQRERTRQGGPAVLAITADSRDPLDDDSDWAARAIRLNPALDHRILAAERLPLAYTDLAGAATERLDEPSIALVQRSRVLAVTGLARRAGSQVHLTGHGGDHLFVGLPTLSLDLLRTHPWAAVRRIAAYRGMFGWSWPDTTRQLARRRSYRRWLARCAVTRGPAADWRTPLLTWGVPTTLPDWVTPYAVDLVHGEIGRAAATAHPLAPTPGRHLELDGIRDGARLVRALADLTGRAGLPISAPFLDDRVIEAALSVRIEERVQPHVYKPLLQRAMADVLPRQLLARTTKGVGDLDLALGVREHATDLVGLWKDSHLAARGLVDTDRLTVLCGQPDAPQLDDGALLTTVACELWLRAADSTTTLQERTDAPSLT